MEHVEVAAESGQHHGRLQGILVATNTEKRITRPTASASATAGTTNPGDDGSAVTSGVGVNDVVAGASRSAISRCKLGHHTGVADEAYHSRHGLGDSALDCRVDGVDLCFGRDICVVLSGVE